jgi:hypothetical protein
MFETQLGVLRLLLADLQWIHAGLRGDLHDTVDLLVQSDPKHHFLMVIDAVERWPATTLHSKIGGYYKKQYVRH